MNTVMAIEHPNPTTPEEVEALLRTNPILAAWLDQIAPPPKRRRASPKVILPRTERERRLDALEAALRVDVILTTGQLRRWYGLELRHLDRRFKHAPFRLPSARHHAKVIRTSGIVLSGTKSERLLFRPYAMRHNAGVTEMRHLLGADPRDWNIIWEGASVPFRRTPRPDAVWNTPKGPVGVEYDCGTGTRRKSERKLYAFELRYDRLIWGAVSKKRLDSQQRRLTAIREGLQDKVEFLQAFWW